MDKLDLGNSYAGIGRCIVEFQSVEALLGYAINGLLTLPLEHTKILLSEYGFSSKINIFNSLVKNVFEEHSKYSNALTMHEAAESIVQQLNSCAAARNKIAHSHWIDASKGYEKYFFGIKDSARSKKGFQTKIIEYNAEEISRVVGIMASAKQELSEFSGVLELDYDRIHATPLLASMELPVEKLVKTIKNHILYESSFDTK